MSYQVLARKWRPKTFREMVGQEHVLKALINALDHDRLHHAYLFTGTRGVGKTTIARILAKCLNCESGVSSEPCGVCGACQEIAEGRFIDLIEVDAASRTKVEDTRELLENVQYAPSRGRYKIYLIDEVHMLSTHSFNALLKTLEEPPPHVKFLLATTDPQKLPATILSRCLQFHLKNMTPERIVAHLAIVLAQELLHFEEPALWLLGRAADGSMRDALSLTDQAIAFGSGKVGEADVRAMLGSIDQGVVYELLEALSCGDGNALMAAVARTAEQATDFAGVLEELLMALHRVAVAQAVPDAVDNSGGDRDRIVALAAAFSSEDVQLYYQMGLLGRRDLPLAPDGRVGLEMALLRMLAFRPQGMPQPPVKRMPVGENNAEKKSEPAQPAVAASAREPVAGAAYVASPANVTSITRTGAAAAPVRVSEPVVSPTPARAILQAVPSRQAESIAAPVVSRATEPTPAGISPSPAAVAEVIAFEQFDNGVWVEQFHRFGLGGVLGTIASHCELRRRHDLLVEMVLDMRHAAVFDEAHTQRLQDHLRNYFGNTLKLQIDIGQPQAETPFMRRDRIRQERRAAAHAAIVADPNILLLQEGFGALLDEASIEPVDE
ncbi:MAG: DNA polymerase III subunit gamma/tau [Spongiibacteraceae bacterium]